MSQNNIIIDYSREPDNDLDNFSEGVVEALDGNANFTFESGEFDELKKATETYKEKLKLAQNGTSLDVEAKNTAKAALAKQLNTVAKVVDLLAKGNKEKLKSSGFRLVKEKGAVGILPKPTGLKVASGLNSGDFMVEVDANENANMYYFYSTPTPAPDDIEMWRLTPSTKRKVNISKFVKGKEYEFKAAYKGTEDNLTYSDSKIIYAQ